MKKLLSLLGAASIAAGASSAGVVLVNNQTQYKILDNNQSSMIMTMNALEPINATNLAVQTQTEESSSIWTTLNQIFDMGFTNSTDYKPWVETYTNSWRDFGWKIVFPEGDVNVMRLIKLINTAYNSVNFQPLEDLLNKGMPIFEYITSLQDHDEDKVSVLYGMLTGLIQDLKDSPLPFTSSLISQLQSATSLLRFLQNQNVTLVGRLIDTQIKGLLGMSLQELGENYKTKFQAGLVAIQVANGTLKMFKDTLPVSLFNLIMENANTVANQMINADVNENGVEWIVQYYVNPKGFSPRK